jgi:hypothetical protein
LGRKGLAVLTGEGRRKTERERERHTHTHISADLQTLIELIAHCGSMGRISATFAHHPSLKMYFPSLIWLQYFRLSFSALLTCFKECIVSDGADLCQHVLQSKREEVQEVMTLSGNTTRRSEESILWSPARRLPTRRWRHTNRKRQEGNRYFLIRSVPATYHIRHEQREFDQTSRALLCFCNHARLYLGDCNKNECYCWLIMATRWVSWALNSWRKDSTPSPPQQPLW